MRKTHACTAQRALEVQMVAAHVSSQRTASPEANLSDGSPAIRLLSAREA